MGSLRVSVVIACVNGLPSIDECLTALKRECADGDAEIIVVNCCRDGTVELIERKFPSVILLDFARRLGIPELRAIGMSKATGDIVVIIEDHCIVQEGWLKEITTAHQQGHVVVGGTVINGSVERLLDWAVFLCEYSGVMPPAPHGEVEAITGNNVSYRKEILERIDDSVKRYCWEFFLHEQLKQAGIAFFSAPTIVVSHKKEFGFWYFLSQRYHYSRSFAGMRRARTSVTKRVIYLCASPLLPALMLLRIAQQVVQKQRHIDKLVLTLPILLVFLMSYAAGEFVGYLGGPGNSLLKVE